LPTFSPLKRELQWYPSLRQLAPLQPNSGLRPWLLDAGSLTTKLIQLSGGTFRVAVLRQVFARATADEARALGIAYARLCLVREVVLLGQDEPWVFARSVLPLGSLTGRLRHLRKQGIRPLGAFLFSQPRLIRSPIELALIQPRHRYVPHELMLDESLFGRRSIFWLDGKPLLVSEVFLPAFPAVHNGA
jgi:chorismate lyase